MATFAAIIGRLCLAALFVAAGIGKLMDPAGTAQYITATTSLPANLAVPSGIFEIVAGLLLGIGFMTRLTAIVLAGFVALVTLLFHYQITDPAQGQQALKNLAIFGGLLMVFAYGQVSWRMSSWKERDRRHDAELAAARAEAKAEVAESRHEAELAAARADARVDAAEHQRTVVVDRDPAHRSVIDRHDGDPRT